MAEQGDKKAAYKLTYFDGMRGRAEPIRMMFRLAGQEFDDVKVGWEQWQTMKPTTPFRKLPLLETEYGVFAQTTSIANYIADQLGFQPKCKWQRAASDSILVSINDATSTILSVYQITVYKFMPDPGAEKVEELRNNVKDCLKRTFDYVENLSKKGKKFIFADEIQVADIFLFHLLDYASIEFAEFCNRHSDWLRQWKKSYESDPRIADYLKNRPSTMFGT